MGPALRILLSAILGITVSVSIIWACAAVITSCSEEPEVPWEQLDDDRDGYRNGEDLWPYDPELH